jgi:hypothetical protein
MSLQALMNKIGHELLATATSATSTKDEASTPAKVADVVVAASPAPNSQIASWRAAIEAVPAPCNRNGERLLNASLAFLASEQATPLLSCGWDYISC